MFSLVHELFLKLRSPFSPSYSDFLSHVVDPKTEIWYHLDEMYRVWTCDCTSTSEIKMAICVTIDESLLRQGELRQLDRKIAEKRKILGLKVGDKI